MSVEISWDKALRALFGVKLDDGDIAAWEYYLKSENTTSAELVPAIEMAAAENMKAEEWCYTVRDLRLWLKIHRHRRRLEKDKTNTEAKIQSFIAMWREKMVRGARTDDFLESVDLLGYSVSVRNDICAAVLEGRS